LRNILTRQVSDERDEIDRYYEEEVSQGYSEKPKGARGARDDETGSQEDSNSTDGSRKRSEFLDDEAIEEKPKAKKRM
jgi:hypothetical protein